MSGIYVYGSLAYDAWIVVTTDVDVTTPHRTDAQEFGVLTLYRVLYSYETGEIVSNREAARWTQSRMDPARQPVIEQALTRYREHQLGGSDHLLAGQGEAFGQLIWQEAE